MLAEDLRSGTWRIGRLIALAARLPKAVANFLEADRRAVGVRYSDDVVCERASAGGAGVSGLSLTPSVQFEAWKLAVGAREDVEISRISESWCTRCRARAEIGRVKASILEGRGNREGLSSSEDVRFGRRNRFEGSKCSQHKRISVSESNSFVTFHYPLRHQALLAFDRRIGIRLRGPEITLVGVVE